MSMQTDVLSVHLHESGFAVNQPTRLKAFGARGTATAGQLDIFDTTSVPVAATYGQVGYVVTVTKVAHGLKTGQKVGIAFEAGTGGTPNSGAFTITVLTADTFTVTTLNSRSITAGADCRYALGGWVVTIELAAGDSFNNYALLPGQGILAREGIYVYMLNLSACNIYYG